MEYQFETKVIAANTKQPWLKRLFKRIEPQDLLEMQLRNAELDLLCAKEKAEYYTAHSRMLVERIQRLRNAKQGH